MVKRSAFFAWLVVGLGAVFYCYEYLLRIAPSVMTQELMSAFSISAGTFGGMVSFYYLAYTPMQLPVGLLMDRFGPRRLLTAAALVCALGSYIFIQSLSLHLAELGRFLIGFGSAFAFVGVLKLGSLWLPSNRFGLAVGIVMTIAMLGVAKGNSILQQFVISIGWRAAINYLVIAGVVIAAIVWFAIPSQKHDAHISLSSQSLSFKQLGRELLQLFCNPQMWLVGIVGMLLYLSLTAFAELWGVSYIERVYEVTHTQATVLNSYVFYGWALGPPLVGYFSDRICKRRMPIILCAVVAFLLSTILICFPEYGKSWLAGLLFLLGIFSSAQILVFAIAKELNAPGLAGTAIALTNMLVMIGGNFVQPLIGIVLDTFLGKRGGTSVANLQAFSAHDFQVALSVLPIGIALSLIVVIFIKETHAKPREENEPNKAKDSQNYPFNELQANG